MNREDLVDRAGGVSLPPADPALPGQRHFARQNKARQKDPNCPCGGHRGFGPAEWHIPERGGAHSSSPDSAGNLGAQKQGWRTGRSPRPLRLGFSPSTPGPGTAAPRTFLGLCTALTQDRWTTPPALTSARSTCLTLPGPRAWGSVLLCFLLTSRRLETANQKRARFRFP